jgi:hypothetical protein
LVTETICPPVMSWATPRPAVMSTRVAMIGWTPMVDTRKPFQTPRARPANTAMRTAVAAVTGEPGSGEPAM